MKYDMKKYLSLGVVLAGSALMISCDDTGDDVYVTEDSGVADAITDAIGDKPVAPIGLAYYPLTSLKLSFDQGGSNCVASSFTAGDELEIDFDSTDVTSAEDTVANAQADLNASNFVVFGFDTTNGYIENIQNLGSVFKIDFVKEGNDASGNAILSNLTFTPLASDQRSVTGRFTGSAVVEVAFNQDTDNVVIDYPVVNNVTIDLPDGAGTAPVNTVTIYEDVDGRPVEVERLNGSVTHESLLGSTNYGVSLSITVNGSDCVVNFAIAKSTLDGLPNAGGDVANLPAGALQELVDEMDLDSSLNVADSPTPPIVNDIAANSPSVHLIEGADDGGVTGSYRHDYDSTFGTAETLINSQND